MTDKIRQKPEEKSGMEVIVKRLKRMISTVLVCGLVLGMSGCGGCGKKEVYQGGEGTNFPYTCQKEGKGTYLIKLDGSYGEKDYRWTAENSDEAVVKVEVAKKEKKGKVSYRVTPLSDGMAEITFTRQREVEDSTAETDTAAAENTADAAGATTPDATTPDATTPDATADNAADGTTVDTSYYDSYMDRFRAKDVLSEITFRFEVDHSGEKGKIRLNFVSDMCNEQKGIMQSEDQGTDYKVWEDSDGLLYIRLPYAEAGWDASWEGEYIAPEDPGIPGIIIPEPEKEDGRYVILSILKAGIVDGAMCFSIEGLAQGTATLQFTDTEGKRRVVLEVEISSSGVVTVVSHRTETL